MRELPARAELGVVQYPGRGDLFSTLAVDDVRRRAAAVSGELPTLEFAPLVLFGKSRGALVGYETALALRRAGAWPALLVVLLLILRSDLRADESYEAHAQPPLLDCPVLCYHGIRDPQVDEAVPGQWSEIVSRPFSQRRGGGGHFHIFLGAVTLVEEIFLHVPFAVAHARVLS